jgi:hypothetical protein
MVVGKSGCASAARRNQRDGVGPVTVSRAGIGICWRPRNCPFLEVGTSRLVLNCNDFSLLKQRQKNINIRVVISQVADIDARGACLRGIIPKKIAIARIARRSSSIGPIEEQA